MQGQDSLQNLESTIYYYEKVADPGDDPERKRTLKRVADHLRDLMTMVRGKLECGPFTSVHDYGGLT